MAHAQSVGVSTATNRLLPLGNSLTYFHLSEDNYTAGDPPSHKSNIPLLIALTSWIWVLNLVLLMTTTEGFHSVSFSMHMTAMWDFLLDDRIWLKSFPARMVHFSLGESMTGKRLGKLALPRLLQNTSNAIRHWFFPNNLTYARQTN